MCVSHDSGLTLRVSSISRVDCSEWRVTHHSTRSSRKGSLWACMWGNEPQNIKNHRRLSFYGRQLYSVSKTAVRGHKERPCSLAMKGTHPLCSLTHICSFHLVVLSLISTVNDWSGLMISSANNCLFEVCYGMSSMLWIYAAMIDW